MLTIEKEPNIISLSRNNMLLRMLATDDSGNPFSSQGVRSEMTRTGFLTLTENDVIVINWTEPDGATGSVSFTAKNTPILETHVPADDSPFVTNVEYWQAVANAMAAHHLIGPHFTLYAVQNASIGISLWIETIDIDADWVVTFDITGVTNPGYSVNDYPEVLASTSPDNYKVYLQVMFEPEYESGNFMLACDQEVTVNADSQSVFDLHRILDAEIRNSLPELMIPAFVDNTPYKPDTIRRYYYRYKELYDGHTPEWVNGSIKYVMCGGIPQQLFAAYNFFDSITGNNSLLTWYPDRKHVSPDQPEWIAWYNYTGGTLELKLQVNTFEDGDSTPTITTAFAGNGIAVKAREVILIPVGPTQLGLADTVVKYSVRVMEDIVAEVYYSQERTFYIDRLYHFDRRYIFYLNAFCLPQTLRCIGRFSDQLMIDRQESMSTLAAEYTTAARELQQYDQTFDNDYTFRTGFIGKEEVQALQEMLIYNQLHEVYAAGYRALYITDKRYNLYTTGDFLHSVEFKAIRALSMQEYGIDDQILQPGQSLITTCKIILQGDYDNEADAIAGGVLPGQYYALTNNNYFSAPAGIVVMYMPTVTYKNDVYAYLGGVRAGGCYVLSDDNDMGMPPHTVRILSPSVTYNNDLEALSGGVAAEIYALGFGNDYAFPENIMKKRLI